MGDATAARALVAACCFTPRHVVDLAPACTAAIAVAAVAVAAQHHLDAAARAQEQASWTVHAHHRTWPLVLDGRVPARHTAVAPPSSARCRARRSRQASRRDRTAAVPTFFGMAALYRAAPRLVSRRPRPGAGVPKPITSTLVVTTAAAPLVGVGFARACLAALQGGQAGAHPSPINATLNNLSRP